jgi:hypothetical protein
MPAITKCCQFCRKTFATQRKVNQHISASAICLEEWHKNIVRNNDNQTPKRRRVNSPEPNSDENLPNPYPIHDFDDANHQLQVEANMEEPEEEDDVDQATPMRYIEPFPEPAGEALRQEKTRFHILEESQRLEGKSQWEPFASRAEWELAEWLMKNVGQKAMDEYLQLPIVSWHLYSIKKTHIFQR